MSEECVVGVAAVAAKCGWHTHTHTPRRAYEGNSITLLVGSAVRPVTAAVPVASASSTGSYMLILSLLDVGSGVDERLSSNIQG